MTLPANEVSGLSYIRTSRRNSSANTAQNDDVGRCETRNRPSLRAVNHDQKKAVFFKPRCKSWYCPYCAKVNRSLLVMRTCFGVETLLTPDPETSDYPTLSFLTLTSHEKLDAKTSLIVWPKAWNKLRKRAKRAAPAMQYMLVPEMHQDGRLHVHALETAGLGERWWKDNGRECGMGFMAEEDTVKSVAYAGWYIAKYTSKAIEFARWPKGFRRYRASGGWPKLPELPEAEGWIFQPLAESANLSNAALVLADGGYEVMFLDHLAAWKYVKQNTPEGV